MTLTDTSYENVGLEGFGAYVHTKKSRLPSNPPPTEKNAGLGGFEPPTNGFGDRRSNQLELQALLT